MVVCLPFPVILSKKRMFQNMRRENRMIPGSGSRIRGPRLEVKLGSGVRELQQFRNLQGRYRLEIPMYSTLYNSHLQFTSTSAPTASELQSPQISDKKYFTMIPHHPQKSHRTDKKVKYSRILIQAPDAHIKHRLPSPGFHSLPS